jgi:PsbP
VPCVKLAMLYAISRRLHAALDLRWPYAAANDSVLSNTADPRRLSDFGTPQEVAQFLLDKQIAPPGRGVAAELIIASSRQDSTGHLYYEVEYRVTRHEAVGWQRHNIAVLCASDDVLYTFNAQCGEARWPDRQVLLRTAARSFEITA